MRTLSISSFVLILLLAFPAMAQHYGDEGKQQAVYRMYADYKKEFPDVEDISPGRARLLLESGKALFVDVRKPAEMEVSRIPGAIGENEFLKNLNRYGERTVIGYCTVSYRSGLLAEKLAGKGIKMLNLKGGILAWTLEGGKVVDPAGNPVKRLHVYGPKWDYAPAGYETVMFGWFDRMFQRDLR